MLGMAFFKSLVKQHGMTYFEPIGKALQAAGIKTPNLLNPAHALALRSAATPYMKWLAGQYLSSTPKPSLPPMPPLLRQHAEFAAEELQRSPREISAVMRKHQLKLADRQCRMADLSARLQQLIVILCTSLYASRIDDEAVRQAAHVVCGDLTRLWTGRRPTDRNFRDVTSLGEFIVEGGFKSISGLEPDEILMPYEQ
jgi:hypothetical protein